ncbi:MAG TPA: imidazole glycerol phosphate synthase subunit HisH [Cyclobacteriaceae bacterium]|nr:imidazole glycerol phosphate synthase subunit HisH [Cyclobacteriaceae bacterium]
MKVAVVKYNAGNIQSVSYALERMGIDFEVTPDPEKIAKADKVIFPGVGEASTTMSFLRSSKLDRVITDLKQPVLGICLGMQLLCKHSEENNTQCLGIFDEVVKRFEPSQNFKVPHMGWNSLNNTRDWIDQDLTEKYVYFVHSYYVPVNNNTVAQTDYVVPFSAAMRKNNFHAVQFHPEKSAEAGEQILKAFLEL